jgi:hypothetical protein
MSYKIIEKEISWDEFIAFLLTATVLAYDGYCFDISRVRLEKDNVVIYNGPCVWSLLRKEDNEIIKYGLGSFYFNKREYDEEESEETDNDGYPIFKALETYNLVEKEIKFHQLKIL